MPTPEVRPPQVLVDHPIPLVAAGLCAVLAQHDDLHLPAGRAGLDDPPPDVVICDHANGLRWLAQAATRPAPAPRVLIVTAIDREPEVRQALERGAHGYLMLDCSADEVLAAVRQLARGQRQICAEAAQRIVDSFALPPLTPRELQVLRLLAAGQSNKAIGQGLGLAVGTVKVHVKSVLVKLGARSRTEAMSIGLRRGLIAPTGLHRAGHGACGARADGHWG